MIEMMMMVMVVLVVLVMTMMVEAGIYSAALLVGRREEHPFRRLAGAVVLTALV